ncbi:hypothetical protein ACHAPG_005361 [Botrytis cinerea]
MPTSYKIPTPDKLPEGDDNINFAHRRLRKLVEIIRNLNRKERKVQNALEDLWLAQKEFVELAERKEARTIVKENLMTGLAPDSEEY